MKNLKSVLEHTATRYGDKDAIVYGDRRISYSEIEKEANRFASALLRSGIQKGDRVALFLSNSPEFLIAFFGIVRIGAIAAPLDQQYKIAEIRSLFTHMEPAALVSESGVLDLVSPYISEFPSLKLVIEVDEEARGRFTEYSAFLDTGDQTVVSEEPSPDDVAAVMYTSSPSFKPMGVMLTHNSFIQEAAMSAEGYRQTEDDIMMLFALPMFHVFGLVSAALGSITSGSTIVIVPGTGLSIGSFLAAVEREQGTMYLGVPFIYALAVDMARKEAPNYDLSTLRICSSAGAPLSIRTAERFKALYGKQIIDCYGLTEAVSHVTCPDLDREIQPGSAGKPLSGWKLKILDDRGNEVPPGTSGEIFILGPVMKGYYREPEATAAVIKDGWLDTGDVGCLDRDGNLSVNGRTKETIIVKGQNIYPVDPETVIASIDGVEEVTVLGVPDAMRGEIVTAAIHVREGTVVTEQEVRQVCLDSIAGYKVPRKVKFTGSFPRKENGVVDKALLRKQLKLTDVFPVL